MRKFTLTILLVLLVLMPIMSSMADNTQLPVSTEAVVEGTDGVEATEASDGEELIRNGSFDSEGASFWNDEAWQEGYSASIIDYNGESVAYIAASGVENDVRFYQQVKTEPHTSYIITCKIKTNNIIGGNGANIAVTNTYAYSTPILGTNDWQEVTLVGTTGEDQTS
ncbi:MAG: hypothetical protein IJO48_02020, partial [Clostridia bacterium]|nr:hypothetical protein [Clostridia bacterium]